MQGSRRVLVKVVLFQSRGRGHPQDDATPNFFADFQPPIYGLSNEVSFVPKFFEKVVKIKETSLLLSKCCISIAHHCRYKVLEHFYSNISCLDSTNIHLHSKDFQKYLRNNSVYTVINHFTTIQKISPKPPLALGNQQI